MTNGALPEAADPIEDACKGAQTPLVRLEHALHGVVAFGVLPPFALANAGARLLRGGQTESFASPATRCVRACTVHPDVPCEPSV